MRGVAGLANAISPNLRIPTALFLIRALHGYFENGLSSERSEESTETNRKRTPCRLRTRGFFAALRMTAWIVALALFRNRKQVSRDALTPEAWGLRIIDGPRRQSVFAAVQRRRLTPLRGVGSVGSRHPSATCRAWRSATSRARLGELCAGNARAHGNTRPSAHPGIRSIISRSLH